MVENIKILNLNKNIELDLSALHTPDYVIESVLWRPVDSDIVTTQLYSHIGEHIDVINYKGRIIEISGAIIAKSATEMNNRKIFLNSFVNPTHDLRLLYKDYSIDFKLQNSILYSSQWNENNEVLCKFKINGFAAFPLFSNVTDKHVLTNETEPMFHFPLIMSRVPANPGGIVFGKIRNDTLVSIFNTGDVITGMRIIVTFLQNSRGFTLTNVDTQEKLSVVTTFYDTEILEINTNRNKRDITITQFKDGVPYTSPYLQHMSNDSVWLQIALGHNNFVYSVDTGIVNVEIFFNESFFEVQRWD
jgi:Phage tail protein.